MKTLPEETVHLYLRGGGGAGEATGMDENFLDFQLWRPEETTQVTFTGEPQIETGTGSRRTTCQIYPRVVVASSSCHARPPIALSIARRAAARHQ